MKREKKATISRRSYTESEKRSYLREYLSSPEDKASFARRTGLCRTSLSDWLTKYHLSDKDMKEIKSRGSSPAEEQLAELQSELSQLRAENKQLSLELKKSRLLHAACEEMINLTESTYHIKVRKNSDAK